MKKGSKHTEESKRKNSLSNMGKVAWNKNLTKEIDKRIDYNRPSVFKKGHIMNINTRKKISITSKGRKHSDETKQKIAISKRGCKNPSWNGGSSFEPYSREWTKKLKNMIKNRDNNECQLCFNNFNIKNYILEVHHIDHNKKNCSKKNLITLCKSCHSKVKFNRNVWENLILNHIEEYQVFLNRICNKFIREREQLIKFLNHYNFLSDEERKEVCISLPRFIKKDYVSPKENSMEHMDVEEPYSWSVVYMEVLHNTPLSKVMLRNIEWKDKN